MRCFLYFCLLCDYAHVRKNGFHFAVRTRDNVYGNEISDFSCCRRACICGCLDCCDIAAHHNGYESAADMLFADQRNICCLYHRVGRLDRADKSFCFDHSKCL